MFEIALTNMFFQAMIANLLNLFWMNENFIRNSHPAEEQKMKNSAQAD